MKENIYKIFLDDIREKKIAGYGAYHRKASVRGPKGRAKLLSDQLTKAELKKLSGECVTMYDIKSIISKDKFIDMDFIKRRKVMREYVKHFESIDLAKQWGLSRGAFMSHVYRLALNAKGETAISSAFKKQSHLAGITEEDIEKGVAYVDQKLKDLESGVSIEAFGKVKTNTTTTATPSVNEDNANLQSVLKQNAELMHQIEELQAMVREGKEDKNEGETLKYNPSAPVTGQKLIAKLEKYSLLISEEGLYQVNLIIQEVPIQFEEAAATKE